MADIDLVVAPTHRAAAVTALERAGLQHVGSRPWEDTLLAWGNGAVGRTDGESANHNGKVELHPGLCERFHNYLVSDGGMVVAGATPGTLAQTPCHRLGEAAFAAHVVGHLSASVVRAEVRALNIVDAALVIRALDDTQLVKLGSLCSALDARLCAPGLWLLNAYAPSVPAAELLAPNLDRLAGPARRLLAQTAPRDVLRDPAARTTWAWRWSFAERPRERAGMARQFVWPSQADVAPGAARGGMARQVSARAARLARAARGPRAAPRSGASPAKPAGRLARRAH